ncbi:MAG TPA: hypothetical protein VHB46_07035 [Burkholderiales bacterium]|nr:hypothetical protein [Burkholderiales bacterium]
MAIEKPVRTEWNAFPDVLIHAQESVVKKHADYRAAKAGEIDAARRLVEDTMNEKSVAAAGGLLAGSNAMIASVHAREAEGINRIPAILAEVLGERLGLQAEESVVQINRSGHTGADGYRPTLRFLTVKWSRAEHTFLLMTLSVKAGHWPISRVLLKPGAESRSWHRH